jgi:hypothetical protein
MGIRYYRRVNYGDGLGLNISKSGVSPSIRTNLGSFGSKAFSIRTGIPGLSYRGGTGKNGAAIGLVIMAIAGGLLIVYNLMRLILYGLSFVFSSIFKPDGIDYINIVIFLAIILCLLILAYYFLPIN